MNDERGAQRLAASLWSAHFSTNLPDSGTSSAQRLAASLWSARDRTPSMSFFCTGAQRLAASLWSARGPRPRPRGTGRSAQRLAASLWSAPTPAPTTRAAGSCAQRLAASLWSAHDNGHGTHCLGMCSTPCGVTVVCTGRRGCTGRRRRWCSTPCGVTVVCTVCGGVAGSLLLSAQRLAASLWSAPRGGRRCGSATAVLNALRRHCGLHAIRLRQRYIPLVCSTPCGVTVVCTVVPTAACWKYFSAQRLAASLWSAQRCVIGGGERCECSTPCGVTVVCTGRCVTGGRAAGSAQRLAASLWSARADPRAAECRANVLNALRRHCGLHSGRAAAAGRARGCSTPCGVTVVCTQHHRGAAGAAVTCSTPCGVTVVCTASYPVTRPAPTRAQRLAASLWSALPVHRGPLVRRQCSTPCGVTVVCTRGRGRGDQRRGECSTPCGVTVVCTSSSRSRAFSVFGAQRLAASLWSAHRDTRYSDTVKFVLNALRRHCGLHLDGRQRLRERGCLCSTPCGVTVVCTVPALYHLGFSVACSTPCGVTVVCTCRCPPGTMHLECAQRLAASLWSAPPAAPHPRSPPAVLNALRRHCGLHPARPPRAPPGAGVLNALRRHCGLHIRLAGWPTATVTCSTPCGVTVVCTLEHLDDLHHVGRCSTPCGVTVVCTPPSANGKHRPDGCSTPCGVTVVCTQHAQARVDAHVSCSTPCGVTVVCTTFPRPPPRSSRRAQRLAASLWSARESRPDSPGGFLVLNALRRHCGLHLNLANGTDTLAECSTPCGVTVVCTVCPAAAVTRLAGAQRLAASLWSAPAHAVPRPHRHRVLNALRRHCGLHDPRRRPPRHRRVVCSTPCGVTVVCTPPDERVALTVAKCSTPCGVTVVCTSPSAAMVRAKYCAQRLAASLWSAQSGCSGRSRAGLCSTPCGVTVVCTVLAGGAADQLRVQVLNALRRHCGLHRAGGGAAERRQHVLNALRRHCGLHSIFSLSIARYSGAQRLAASLWSARAVAVAGGRVDLVLNALRRHCGLHVAHFLAPFLAGLCSTPCGVTVVCTMRRMTPAFRRTSAQRLAASLWSAPYLGLYPVTKGKCSTPCGVTVVCTPGVANLDSASGSFTSFHGCVVSVPGRHRGCPFGMSVGDRFPCESSLSRIGSGVKDHLTRRPAAGSAGCAPLARRTRRGA